MNNLDICGIPKTTNKSLFDILPKLSYLVNANLQEEDVSKLYRNKMCNDLNSNIIVMFNNKKKKEKLLKASKSNLKSNL